MPTEKTYVSVHEEWMSASEVKKVRSIWVRLNIYSPRIARDVETPRKGEEDLKIYNTLNRWSLDASVLDADTGITKKLGERKIFPGEDSLYLKDKKGNCARTVYHFRREQGFEGRGTIVNYDEFCRIIGEIVESLGGKELTSGGRHG